MIQRLKRIITDINLFSTLVVQLPLRRYQTAAANAVIQSCLRGAGLDFLWIFPRQSGKDETIAQLCVFLLTLFQRTEASIVHVYPTQQQCQTGITRLEQRLNNALTLGSAWSKAQPPRRGLGSAQVAFFSGHPQTKPEGATANLLLIINETTKPSSRRTNTGKAPRPTCCSSSTRPRINSNTLSNAASRLCAPRPTPPPSLWAPCAPPRTTCGAPKRAWRPCKRPTASHASSWSRPTT